MYLNCKTYYSLRYGTIATEELVQIAAKAGVTSLALTNINTTADGWDFVKYCLQEGIKPILGAEIRNGQKLLYVLIAANNNGFAWINKFLSDHFLAEKPFPELSVEYPFFNDIRDGYVLYPLNSKQPESLFGNELIGVLPTEVYKLFSIRPDLLKTKFVIRQPVTFQSKGYYKVHQLLRAIDNNSLLSMLASETICSPQEHFIDPSSLLEKFKQYPFIVTNTYRLMDNCSIDMDHGHDKTKKVFGASREDDRILLSKLSYDGLTQRYAAKNKEARQRIEKELFIINKLDFNAYFLVAWDIIRYAKSKGYFHVGRGSGANSTVAYCLGITDVDPIELNLYFERFLNPHRSSPPDFDIDFSWADRDDVFDYIFKRYGKDFVARLGTYATFQYNAIIWELGKVYGLPEAERKQLGEKGYYNGDTRGENFTKKTQEDKIARTILQFGKYMQHFPDKLSVHTGGIVISQEPLYNYTATYMPKSGFVSSQIDMFISEDIGLYKLDILSQRGLGHIKTALQLVKQNRGIDIDIHAVEKFKKDDRILSHLRAGNTIGCFYGESPAIRHVMKKLQCENYETLIAASSIIRPGVGKSGMMNEFIQRHNGSLYVSLHPKLAAILKDTHEVMIYQENIIQVAKEWAGMDDAEADMLRRSTSFKNRIKGGINSLKNKFFEGCAKAGYHLKVVEEVWRQMESFGDFSFCKAHAASYAAETFQSLYLKTYYPMEFMVAVINNFGGYYNHSSRELYFYELMKTGAHVYPPCVNNSMYLTSIAGSDVYMGFIHIEKLEEKLALHIIDERNRSGTYIHMQDFIERSGTSQEQLRLLIKAGALRFTGKTKQQLFWEGDFLQRRMKNHITAKQSLFKDKPREFFLPHFHTSEMDEVYDQVQLLGFPVCNPFVLVDDDPQNYLPAAEMKSNLGKTVTVLGYHITNKPVRTIHNETMSFGTFIDANLDWIDTVHFPLIHKRVPLRAGFYRVTGEIVEEFGVYTIVATDIAQVGIKEREKKDEINVAG